MVGGGVHNNKKKTTPTLTEKFLWHILSPEVGSCFRPNYGGNHAFYEKMLEKNNVLLGSSASEIRRLRSPNIDPFLSNCCKIAPN